MPALIWSMEGDNRIGISATTLSIARITWSKLLITNAAYRVLLADWVGLT